jgi:hypothetical protein
MEIQKAKPRFLSVNDKKETNKEHKEKEQIRKKKKK